MKQKLMILFYFQEARLTKIRLPEYLAFSTPAVI